jgi:hypothetical protein
LIQKQAQKIKLTVLSDGKGIPSAYCESLANKVKIRISPKTPTGSKVTTQGMGSSSGSFRLDIRENFATFMENETKVFTESLLLTEEILMKLHCLGKLKTGSKKYL